MAKAILIDEFHLTVSAPRGLPDAEYEAMRRTMDEARFRAGLRRAVRAIFHMDPSLSKVRVTLSR